MEVVFALLMFAFGTWALMGTCVVWESAPRWVFDSLGALTLLLLAGAMVYGGIFILLG